MASIVGLAVAVGALVAVGEFGVAAGGTDVTLLVGVTLTPDGIAAGAPPSQPATKSRVTSIIAITM
jgi:hypothetical protein